MAPLLCALGRPLRQGWPREGQQVSRWQPHLGGCGGSGSSSSSISTRQPTSDHHYSSPCPPLRIPRGSTCFPAPTSQPTHSTQHSASPPPTHLLCPAGQGRRSLAARRLSCLAEPPEARAPGRRQRARRRCQVPGLPGAAAAGDRGRRRWGAPAGGREGGRPHRWRRCETGRDSSVGRCWQQPLLQVKAPAPGGEATPG